MSDSIQEISVIVPENPFLSKEYAEYKHCLCALPVAKLMQWWPGTPHVPHRNADKVKAIQRFLDWKRVAQIAAYLLQCEIVDTSAKLDKYFNNIYEPRKNEPGREWPPKISKVIGFERSEYRVFSNILVHINGAELKEKEINGEKKRAGMLSFDEEDPKLFFSVIDGQHRINGAYLALKILQEKNPDATWDLPAEVFLDLDPVGQPRLQAQIFIDVNFYQKKVDRSLVADLFPTARGARKSLDDKERAQDIGRRLMLETGPLVGMIQIPGIKFGFKDVITLATLNNAIEDILEVLRINGIDNINSQTEFLSQCLNSWLQASGRFENPESHEKKELSPANVAYQGRVLVSVLALIPALIWKLRTKKVVLISDKASEMLISFLKSIAQNAGLLDNGIFIDKNKFKKRDFLGSGGIARFRDLLWASIKGRKTARLKPERVSKIAEENKSSVNKYFSNK
ncbi:MAG: DGQHR domain-containing protein [Ignavibacteriales bacterium]|nr:DGQHR domain-containing protein [Ignavibacteriales bacterium]